MVGMYKENICFSTAKIKLVEEIEKKVKKSKQHETRACFSVYVGSENNNNSQFQFNENNSKGRNKKIDYHPDK